MGITFDAGTDVPPNYQGYSPQPDTGTSTYQGYSPPGARTAPGDRYVAPGGGTYTAGQRAWGMRYAGQAEAWDRLSRAQSLAAVRTNTILGQAFQQLQGASPYAYNNGAAIRLPSWVTASVVDELRRTGMYNGEEVPGLTGRYGEGFGAANYVPDEDYEGTRYLGVANDWEEGYIAVGQTPQGWVLREAIYTQNDVIAELSKMNQAELTQFRGAATLVNLHANARGKQLTGENFGMLREQGVADQDVMAYVMGFANENAMTWDQALDTIVLQATDDYNAGLFGDDGSGSGSGTERIPPIESKTQTSYNLSDINNARALLERYMEQKMGRLPRPGEVRSMLATMNAAERKNPTVTVTNYEYDEFDQRIGETSTTTPGNVDYGAMALRRMDNPEARQFQRDSMAWDTIKKLAGW